MVILSVYLSFFFLALATYSAFLLGQFQISYFAYGTALINALVIAKVILTGEALHAGTRYENKRLCSIQLFGKRLCLGSLSLRST